MILQQILDSVSPGMAAVPTDEARAKGALTINKLMDELLQWGVPFESGEIGRIERLYSQLPPQPDKALIESFLIDAFTTASVTLSETKLSEIYESVW